jgi:hypothetical protein
MKLVISKEEAIKLKRKWLNTLIPYFDDSELIITDSTYAKKVEENIDKFIEFVLKEAK